MELAAEKPARRILAMSDSLCLKNAVIWVMIVGNYCDEEILL